jgi:AraC family transcriptional regulator
MVSDVQSRHQDGNPGAVTTHYGSFITAGEHFRGVWEEERGLAFMDREWTENPRWEAPRREIEGYYNFYIQSKPHLQCGEFNGVPSRALCRAGTVQFVKPDETVHTAGAGETRIFQICISSSYLSSYVERDFIVPAGVDLQSRQLDDIGLAKLARAHNWGSQFGLSMRELYFDELREAMLRRILGLYSTHKLRPKERAESLVPAKTRTVVDFIEANLSMDLRLETLAKVVGLSRAHFARSFRKMTGMSPHLYVQHRRLSRATELLYGRALEIKDIAKVSGFANASHMTRCFKSKFGALPSQISAIFIESSST